ncbi:VOC family protein [Mycobacterium yunnanensis]|uniref:VOC family protein n=1 Tax=Mycobacterium yunnanensis TaxID=368477 RepID=A0A9X2Z1X2_9MYCO|nr:VOC family protein [Mycobacterium yunnanensis]MCV7421395.1 VOC family protein [Mycobacterium yunnanensis]
MTVHSLLQITLLVSDVDASAAFYSAIGMQLYAVDEPGQPHHFEGGIDTTVLQLWPASGGHVTRIQLGLRVFAIEEAAARLDALEMSHERPWPNFLRTRDPDDNRVHLTEVRMTTSQDQATAGRMTCDA